MDQDTLRFLLREAVRETVTEVLQTVLELDRTAFLQAHGGRRNGYYPRRLETTFGQVDLKVPRDREGQYYPAFLKPYARRLVDVGEVAVALTPPGSPSAKRPSDEPPPGHRSPRASAPCRGGAPAVEAFRRRPLPEEMAFAYLDAVLKASGKGKAVVREVVYRGPGGHASGERPGSWALSAGGERPGVGGGPGGAVAAGARRVLLFITRASGSPEAFRTGPSGGRGSGAWCTGCGGAWGSAGQSRTLLAEDLRRVYGAESRGEALEALEALREAWGARYPGVGTALERALRPAATVPRVRA
jgi:putative transposase